MNLKKIAEINYRKRLKKKYSSEKKLEKRIQRLADLLDENRKKIEELRPDERTQRKVALWAKRDELFKEYNILKEMKEEMT